MNSWKSFLLHETAPADIYTLSLHDALPIWAGQRHRGGAGQPDLLEHHRGQARRVALRAHHDQILAHEPVDRKSTRLNSSHVEISYAVFCLKKKTNCVLNDLLAIHSYLYIHP